MSAICLRRSLHQYLVAIFIAFGVGTMSPAFLPVQQAEAQIAIEALDGAYTVDGLNPDGTAYSGRVFITVKNGVAYFRWEIGRQVFQGEGTLDGKVLTVDWSQTHPVIYVVNRDGSLSGTWSNGRAAEKLTPQRQRLREKETP